MDTYERTHATFPAVFVFKIQPRMTTAGYKASDWPKDHIWTGRLRVVSKGAQTCVLLEHTDKEGLFACCVVDSDQAYEQVVDSSRYFALRIGDGKGRHAVVGLGFNDRAQAFEFKVALQDARKLTTKEESGSSEFKDLDFSLPQGGMLHIDLKKIKEKDKAEKDDFLDFASAPATKSEAPAKKEKDPEKKKKKKKDDLDAFANLTVSGGTPSGWVSF